MVVFKSYSSTNLRFPHNLTFYHRSRSFRRRIPAILLFSPPYHHHWSCRQLRATMIWKQGYNPPHDMVKPMSMDEGSLGISPFGDWGNDERASDYMIFSSDGEDSDGEILVTPLNDVNMPTIKKQYVTAEDALTATASRLALLGRMHKKDMYDSQISFEVRLLA